MTRKLITRAQRVGGLSLSALFVGGTTLVFFCINSSTTYRRPNDAVIGYDYTNAVFRVGADWGVETWLSILGVTFGLLSFGYVGTYTHMFDLWCSFRSTGRSSGLDYARYLNSQPYAPVTIGFRGFPAFILVRYMILALGLLATVGYPFAVIEVTLLNHQSIQESLVTLRVPPMRALFQNGTTSPWLGDSAHSSTNRAFLHQHQGSGIEMDDHLIPPTSIVMAGWADCGDIFDAQDEGMLYTREIIMVADQQKTSVEDGDTLMSTNNTGWLRGESSSPNWFSNGTKPSQSQGVVIDYRISEPGTVEIRWAENGDWVQNGSLKQPVAQRLTYNVHLTVGVVQRLVSGGDCSTLSDQDGSLSSVRIVVNGTATVNTERYGEPLQLYRRWIEATLLDSKASPREGVSALLRSIMAEWGMQLQDNHTSSNNTNVGLGHAPLNPPRRPFSPNHLPLSQAIDIGSSRNIHVRYPVYSGTRATGQAGSYYNVTFLFGSLAVITYVVIVIRMALGPAELTSWMGQHVYLALAGNLKLKKQDLGVSSDVEKTGKCGLDTGSNLHTLERLACGFQPARDLGMLRMEPRPKSPIRFPDGWAFGMNRSGVATAL
ncbi:hypothetical protein QBC37DRAFT_274285 [Rhypophila decipiens]|uniref:Uncharacterized protein n=1 Tax=Rhypophila decipiens TaxID=261697 RepID=A0AAN6YME0_9PEZI|nr:hypothetical protein QBC37DRAFT_274285 [Rhypophila decipiens]